MTHLPSRFRSSTSELSAGSHLDVGSNLRVRTNQDAGRHCGKTLESEQASQLARVGHALRWGVER